MAEAKTCERACGDCCYRPGYRWARPYQEDGACKHLTDTGCDLGEDRPTVCWEYDCLEV